MRDSGWEALLTPCDTMPLGRVLAPPIDYAETDFPVADIISFQ